MNADFAQDVCVSAFVRLYADTTIFLRRLLAFSDLI